VTLNLMLQNRIYRGEIASFGPIEVGLDAQAHISGFIQPLGASAVGKDSSFTRRLTACRISCPDIGLDIDEASQRLPHGMATFPW